MPTDKTDLQKMFKLSKRRQERESEDPKTKVTIRKQLIKMRVINVLNIQLKSRDCQNDSKARTNYNWFFLNNWIFFKYKDRVVESKWMWREREGKSSNYKKARTIIISGKRVLKTKGFTSNN